MIDEDKKFQLWNMKTTVKLISEWLVDNPRMHSFTTADVEKKFRLFGGGHTDIVRHACRKLQKDGKLSESTAETKKKQYIFHVIRA